MSRNSSFCWIIKCLWVSLSDYCSIKITFPCSDLIVKVFQIVIGTKSEWAFLRLWRANLCCQTFKANSFFMLAKIIYQLMNIIMHCLCSSRWLLFFSEAIWINLGWLFRGLWQNKLVHEFINPHFQFKTIRVINKLFFMEIWFSPLLNCWKDFAWLDLIVHKAFFWVESALHLKPLKNNFHSIFHWK